VVSFFVSGGGHFAGDEVHDLESVKGGDVGELAVSGDVAQQPPRRRAHIGYERAPCSKSGWFRIAS